MCVVVVFFACLLLLFFFVVFFLFGVDVVDYSTSTAPLAANISNLICFWLLPGK